MYTGWHTSQVVVSTTPRNFFEISDEILNAVDFVVDFRREEEVLPSPSSIIKLGTKGQVKVIR